MAKAIGTLGTIDTLTIGGRTFTDLTTIIRLVGTVASNSRCSMRLHSGTAGYAVTTGKTLTIQALRVIPGSTSVTTFQIAQVDTDLGFSSATAFSNPVYYGGDAATLAVITSGNASNLPAETGGISFSVAATKYVGALNTSGGHLLAWGYEA